MENLGYYNGEIGKINDIKIPMTDRVCFFGDGVYDATIAGNHVIFTLEEHVDRFYESASFIKLNLSISKNELMELLSSLVRKVDSPSQLVYWQATRGTALVRTHFFPENARANIWVMLRPIDLPDLEKKYKLITVEDTRYLHCNIKTLNLLPNVLAAEKAQAAGCQEAVFHRGDRVTECSHSNVHILKNGELCTAPADNYILPGIARSHLIKICKLLEIPVVEKAFTISEMMDADEVLVTSASNFCSSASHINGEPVGGKAENLLVKLRTSLLEEFKTAVK